MQIRPLTPARWPDLESLFGERGACGGCWCMWWRLPRAEWTARKGAANKRAFKKLVTDGPAPGLIAYADGKPAAWCAVGPRESYAVLQKSRTLKPLDETPVWSVTCFFVLRPYRGKGLSVKLLRAAKAYVRKCGGKVLEGYPVEPKKGRLPDAFAWTGLVRAFEKAGFRLAARRGARPIMRAAL